MAQDANTPITNALPDRRELLRSVGTAVVKIGTNVLSRDSGEMAIGRVHTLIEELVDLKRRGIRLIIVSSGAISMGMNSLGFAERPTFLRDKQASAAVGQIRLMAIYQQAFDRFQIPTAQILITEEDFASRKRYLNLRNTMSRLIELGVIPIVNENDSISTSEIEKHVVDANRPPVFGDNDELSALVASKLEADLLLILSDVDGLYPSSPASSISSSISSSSSNSLRPISVVPEINSDVYKMVGSGSARGRGGMASKIGAVEVAVKSGVPSLIANGLDPTTIRRIFDGEDVGSLFLPKGRLQSRKHWIAFASATSGRVHVNDGARDALIHRSSSLLFSGVTSIDEDFRRGDVLSIIDSNGVEFARGMSNYNSGKARQLIGKGRDEITATDWADHPELITRDNIAVRA